MIALAVVVLPVVLLPGVVVPVVVLPGMVVPVVVVPVVVLHVVVLSVVVLPVVVLSVVVLPAAAPGTSATPSLHHKKYVQRAQPLESLRAHNVEPWKDLRHYLSTKRCPGHPTLGTDPVQ